MTREPMSTVEWIRAAPPEIQIVMPVGWLRGQWSRIGLSPQPARIDPGTAGAVYWLRGPGKKKPGL